MNTLRLKKIDIEESDFRYRYGENRDFDYLVSEDSIVYDYDTGRIVAALSKKSISKKTAVRSYPAFMKGFSNTTRNRSAYQGKEAIDRGRNWKSTGL